MVWTKQEFIEPVDVFLLHPVLPCSRFQPTIEDRQENRQTWCTWKFDGTIAKLPRIDNGCHTSDIRYNSEHRNDLFEAPLRCCFAKFWRKRSEQKKIDWHCWAKQSDTLVHWKDIHSQPIAAQFSVILLKQCIEFDLVLGETIRKHSSTLSQWKLASQNIKYLLLCSQLAIFHWQQRSLQVRFKLN